MKGVFIIQNDGTSNMAINQVYFWRPEKWRFQLSRIKPCSCSIILLLWNIAIV